MTFLYENDVIPKELEELERYIRSSPSLYSYFESNFEGIKPKNYCGFLSVNNQSYFIAPKIATEEETNLNIFIYMLIYAYDIKLSNESLLNAKDEKLTIFEIFIQLFSDTLFNELKKGVFKQYITLEENLKTLRGKYLIEKNFSNFYHQNIYCEFDEFSMDNELNRFFLFALRVFKKYSKYPNLSRCEMILDEVQYLNIDFNHLNIQFDRMNSRYKQSYEMALMILQHLIPMVDKSQSQSFAFLFDMAEVFEKFVEKMYKEIEPSAKGQYSKTFNDLYLKPDIWTENKIIDVKYKSYDKSGLNRNDKYQMYVYGQNFGIEDTMILYPKHKNNVHENLKLGNQDKMVNLVLRSLDLEFDGGYNEFIGEVRKRLKRI